MSMESTLGAGLGTRPITRPAGYVARMAVFTVAVAVLIGLLREPLIAAFEANVALNGLILGVLVLGILYNFRMVLMLNPEVGWIESFRRKGLGATSAPTPRLLAPMATMLGEKRGRFSLSTLATRSLLDSIRSRLDESRDLSRYLVGLLIFLGLLGTFWGLLMTVSSVGDVIGNLNVGGGSNMAIWFQELRDGLAAPLKGMGTAFSSSLFGLAGSLILGFLDLQAGQAQNRFFNALEEWLSSLTRLGSGSGIADGEQPVSAYLQALLEQTAENMEGLQGSIQRSEQSQIKAANNLIQMTERIATLTDQMKTEQQLMVRIAEGQMQLRPLLETMADPQRLSHMGFDEATRAHIRNLDTRVAQMVEELSAGRQQSTMEIRSEIKLLARTIAALAKEG